MTKGERVVRKFCEHGASIDLFGSVFHTEAFVIVIAGKIAFVVGCIAVYLVHFEEAGR